MLRLATRLPSQVSVRCLSALATATEAQPAANRKLLGLTVQKANGSEETINLHPLWLRERCTSPKLVHSSTKQRLFETTDYINEDISKSTIIGDSLVVEYSDGHVSTFDAKKLASEALDLAYDYALPPPSPWSCADMPLSKLYFDHALMNPPDGKNDGTVRKSAELDDLVTQMITHGAAVVRNIPTTSTAVEEFGSSIGPLRQTNWGKIFTVRVKPQIFADSKSTEDAAYSNERLMLHVDNPYREPALGYQLLHALKAAPAGFGGESTMADGFYVAEVMRREYPDYFRILADTAVRVQYLDEDTEQIAFLPAIVTDKTTGDPMDSSTQKLLKIASSSRLDFAPALKSHRDMDLYYNARKKWIELLHSPEACLKWTLETGDCLIVDNTRVMHGREQFEEVTERWLQGCYIDKDAMHSNYRVAQRGTKEDAVAGVIGTGVVESTSGSMELQKNPFRGSTEKCQFKSLAECTKDDMELMGELYSDFTSGSELARRAIGLLKAQEGAHCELGAEIDLYQHALQTATRAYRDGASEEMIVVALLHDVGELLSPSNHGDVSAAMLRPYISREAHWALCHHEIFQGLYYYEHYNLDKNARDRWRDNADGGHGGPAPGNAWQLCADFCGKYDAPAFDKDYENMDIGEFIPMVERVFALQPFWDDPTNAKAGAITG